LAGDNATKRGINLAESQGFNIKIVDTYSGAKDPAEIILENPATWQDSLAKARTIMEFYFDSAFAKLDRTSAQGQKEIGKIILPAIKRLQNRIEQSHWVQKLAEKLSINQDAILAELRNVKLDAPRAEFASANANKFVEKKTMGPTGRKKLLEDKIISLALMDSENLALIQESHYCLFCERASSFIKELKAGAPNQEGVAVFADNIKEEYKDFFNILSLRAEVEYEGDGPDEIQLCISQLKELELKNKLNELSSAVRDEGDEQKKEELVKEFNQRAKELHKKN